MSTTETFISRDTPWNDGNAADLQRYHLYLNLIQNVDRNVAFLTQKVFSFDSFSVVSHKQEMRESLLQRNHK